MAPAPPDLHAVPALWNAALFAAAAVAVWLAGRRLSAYAVVVAERTGLGRALVGLVLLATATSLPEVATTASASAIGNAPLAVNNLLGGIAMQVAVLSLADALGGREALSDLVRRPALVLQAALLALFLAVAIVAIAVGEPVLVAGVGLWTILLLAGYVAAVALVRVTAEREEPAIVLPGRGAFMRMGSGRLALAFAAAALVILVAGATLAATGDALAVQTGLGSSFVGAVFVAIATSLPEISTTVAAARLGAHAMAFSNIFGTNLLTLAFLFLADVAYPGGPVLDEVGAFSIVAAALGIAVTAVYLTGLSFRRVRAVGRMGVDSVVALALYVIGVGLLYAMR